MTGVFADSVAGARPERVARRRAAIVAVLCTVAAGAAVATAGAISEQHSLPSTPHSSTQLDPQGQPGYLELGSQPALGYASRGLGPAGGPLAGSPAPFGPHVEVPILLYHYVRVNPEPRNGPGWHLSVEPDEFAHQMAYLRQAGAHTVTVADVLRALTGGAPLPPHPVVLTFDDGYDDFATAAAPVLVQDGLIATDYVVSGFIGRPGYMTADQVRQVAAMGMVIGAHTVHHVDLSKIPLPLATAEIDDSRAALQQLLGRSVTDFAYPYGGYDANVVALVVAAGFHDAVTTESGTDQYLSQRFQLRRIRIGAGDTVASMARKALLPPPPPGTDITPKASTSPSSGSPSSSSAPRSPSPAPPTAQGTPSTAARSPRSILPR